MSGAVVKFTYKKNDDASHWLWCERNKSPFISIEDVDGECSRVFYDVTNLSVSLEIISESVRKIYESYLSFFLISRSDAHAAADEHYVFSLIVKKEHAECVAESLFDYLSHKFLQSP
jgi:hypothetical protein